jgi:hypothetical protein
MDDRIMDGRRQVLHKGRRFIYRGLHATISVYPPQAELEDVETGDWITVPFGEVERLAVDEEPTVEGAASVDLRAGQAAIHHAG